MNNLVLEFGPPNCGKGTYQKIFAATYDFVPLSVGDVCRREKQLNTALWREALADMQATESSLWSTEILLRAMSLPFEQAAQKGQIIFDGWLRDKQQVKPLLGWVLSHVIDRVVIVDFEASDNLCMKRAEQRRRADDVDIHRRLRDFHQDSEPALAELLCFENVFNFDRVTFEAAEAENDPVGYYSDFVMSVGLQRRLKMVDNSSLYNVKNGKLKEAFEAEFQKHTKKAVTA